MLPGPNTFAVGRRTAAERSPGVTLIQTPGGQVPAATHGSGGRGLASRPFPASSGEPLCAWDPPQARNRNGSRARRETRPASTTSNCTPPRALASAGEAVRSRPDEPMVGLGACRGISLRKLIDRAGPPDPFVATEKGRSRCPSLIRRQTDVRRRARPCPTVASHAHVVGRLKAGNGGTEHRDVVAARLHPTLLDAVQG